MLQKHKEKLRYQYINDKWTKDGKIIDAMNIDTMNINSIPLEIAMEIYRRNAAHYDSDKSVNWVVNASCHWPGDIILQLFEIIADLKDKLEGPKNKTHHEFKKIDEICSGELPNTFTHKKKSPGSIFYIPLTEQAQKELDVGGIIHLDICGTNHIVVVKRCGDQGEFEVIE